MKSIVKMLGLTAVVVVLLASCQDLFVKSVFSFVEIDMSSMSDEQKISYAEDLLATGSEEELEAAYAEIKILLNDVDSGSSDLTDSELELVILGADLAIGASGVGDAVSDALDAFAAADESTNPSAVADSILNGFDESDYSNLEDAVELIKLSQANEVELTSQQYTNAAAAQLLVVLKDVEDLGVESPDQLDSTNEEEAAVIANLEQALEWAEAGGLDPSMLGDGIAMPATP